MPVASHPYFARPHTAEPRFEIPLSGANHQPPTVAEPVWLALNNAA